MTLDDVFKSDGLLSSHFSDYELREGQIKMARLVRSAIENNHSAVIEASTGIGKTFAYLVPLILSNESVIISTSNKSLQDQLSNKDLPSLKKILPIDFTWAVLKGKNNYFCHEHFKSHEKEIMTQLGREGLSVNETRLKIKEIIDWAEKTEDGDVEYYPKLLSQQVKDLITCDTHTIHDKDSIFAKLCFSNRARERAKEAKILLVNHTLLALDISLRRETEGKAHILPDTKIIIIDEAHTLERYATMAFSDEISWFSLLHLLNWSIVNKSAGQPLVFSLSKAFKGVLNGFLPEKGINGYYQQKKFIKFEGFEETIGFLQILIEKIKINKKLGKDELTEIKVGEVIKEAQTLISRLEILSEEDPDMLRWSEARETTRGIIVKLKSVPLDISKILKKGLFEQYKVICTSATLAISKSFDFFKYQIGMPENTKELIVESPFDFKKNVLIYVSTGELEKYWEIQQLLTFSQGRAFVLFTSLYEMRNTYERVEIPYPKLIQDNGISRVQLLEEFKNTPNAVLFATKSFWEGVDVKGEQLSMVIIHKLPFDNPSDLIYSSKIEKIDKELGKGKSWMTLTIPSMCLGLKQGVGRLIRSKTDKGVIAILDARINYHNYKKIVLNTLPPAYRTQKLEKVEVFFKS